MWLSFNPKSVQMEKKFKKIQKKPCMFNCSQKCIVSWTSILNILGSVFNFESICVGFENVFFIKFLVNLMSNFNGFWSKSTLHSNTIPKYFIFKLCTTTLSTEWVFIRSCSPILCHVIHFFVHFFCITENLPLYILIQNGSFFVSPKINHSISIFSTKNQYFLTR